MKKWTIRLYTVDNKEVANYSTTVEAATYADAMVAAVRHYDVTTGEYCTVEPLL